MPRVFNLSEFDIRLAAKTYTLENLPPASIDEIVNEITGGQAANISDKDKIAIVQEYLAGSITDPSQIPHALREVKDPSLADSGVAITNQKIRQIKDAISRLKKEDSERYKSILESLGGNEDQLLRAAFEKFQQQYIPQIIDLWSARMNPARIKSFLTLPEDLREQQETATKSLRSEYYNQTTEQFTKVSSDLNEEFGLSAEQIAWIFRGTRTSNVESMPDYENTATRLGEGNLEAGKKLLSKILANSEKDTTTWLSNLQKDYAAGLYAGGKDWDTATDKEGNPLFTPEELTVAKSLAEKTAGAITKHEVLRDIGLSTLQFPQQPSDLFDTGDPAKIQTVEGEDRYFESRNNPFNWVILSQLLEKGGYGYNGKALPNFFGKDFTQKELDSSDWNEIRKQIYDATEEGLPTGSYIDHALFYVAHTLCGKSEAKFKDMLSKMEETVVSDVSVESLFDPDQKVIPDPRYADMLLNFRSKAEKRCVDKLRGTFGLEVVPYELGLPVLDGCNINKDGFQVDFLIPCDVLEQWVQGQDGLYHPVIRQKMMFVGEYYGFDRSNLIEVNAKGAEGYYGIDGDIAKVKDKKTGQTVEAKNGALLTAGQKYDIRTGWKKMTEDFFASSTGNAAIHIDKDLSDDAIISELDRCKIIYSYKMPINNSLNTIKQHAAVCQDPNCASKKMFDTSSGAPVFNKTQITTGEAYVRCCIADLEIQKGMMPVILEARLDKSFGRKEIHDYYTKKKEIEKSFILNRKSPNFSMELEVKLTNDLQAVNSQISFVTEKFNERKQSPEYQASLTALQQLLSEASAGTKTDRDIYAQANNIIKPWIPYIQSRRRANLADLLFRIAISS
jgi:hypothetical protein